MAGRAFEDWYVEGLRAVRTAAEQGRDASRHGDSGRAPPEIAGLLEGGAAVFGRHADTLGQLLERSGGGAGTRPNPFMDGIQEGSRQMIGAAPDADVRAASVVAAAQIAVHYFIAAYGTLASDARHLGLDEDARMLKGMADEMKAADARMTDLAETLANRRASAGG